MNAAVASTLPTSARWTLVALVAACTPIGALIIWRTWWGPWSWFGLFLLSFSPMLTSTLYMRLFRAADFRPEGKRYGRRMGLNMLVYFVTFMGAVILYKEGLTAGPLGYLVAVIPALPIMNCLLLMGRLMRETDEVQRAIMTQAAIWAGALTFGEATLWGFLETFGKAPHLWMWAVPVAFFAQLGITAPLAVRKYR